MDLWSYDGHQKRSFPGQLEKKFMERAFLVNYLLVSNSYYGEDPQAVKGLPRDEFQPKRIFWASIGKPGKIYIRRSSRLATENKKREIKKFSNGIFFFFCTYLTT